MDIQGLKNILSKISFKPSCVDMGWDWETEEIYCKDGSLKGFLINTTFKRPDIVTQELGTGKGRQWFIRSDASETSVIMTAWLAVMQIVDHEMREAFCYNSKEVFYPHKTIDEIQFRK